MRVKPGTVLAALFLLQYSIAGLVQALLLQNPAYAGGDFFLTYEAAGRALGGASPYLPDLSYLRPPFSLLYVTPLLALPEGYALQAFRIVDAAAYFTALALTLAIAGRQGLPPLTLSWRLAAAGLWAFFLPFLHGVYSGQTNGLLLLAIVGSFTLWQRGRSTAAGVVLAGAALTKIYPALLVLLWIRERDRPAVLGFAVSVGLGCVLPLAVFGPLATVDYLRILPFLGAFAASPLQLNLSPGSVITTLLRGMPPLAVAMANGGLRVLSLAAAAAGPRAVPRGAARRELSGQAFAWLLALLLVGGQLIEYHHLVLVLPAACLAAVAARRDSAAPWLYSALAVALELVQLNNLAETWGWPPPATAGYLLLALVCFSVLRRSTRVAVSVQAPLSAALPRT